MTPRPTCARSGARRSATARTRPRRARGSWAATHASRCPRRGRRTSGPAWRRRRWRPAACSEVRDRALEIVAAGGDVELWAEGDPAGARQRERALARLAERLRGPQRAPTRNAAPAVAAGSRHRGRRCRAHRRARGERSALFCIVDMERGRRDARHPVMLALHWRAGEIPSPEELATMPFLSDADLSAPDVADPMYVSAPLLITALVERPGDAFGPHVGAVVARGVHRGMTIGPSGTSATFAETAQIVGSPDFDLYFAATQRRLEAYGDDPEPWVRARAEHMRAAPVWASLLESSGVDPREFGLGPD